MTRSERIAVVYFSVTGNAHRLAHAVAEGAHETDAFHVRHPTPQRSGATVLAGGLR